ncbi:hypothetical protein [Labrys monachus]|uniref:DUF5666 domain-containing protein n=1 Tax=Labrys monachus TaxID=217067 RepID=A0ABU0FIJ2_9HYPH|nr:hypothetical protein [Labrys monachus]MDQ0394326.1 hypothetical protein [Labrys monachus]
MRFSTLTGAALMLALAFPAGAQETRKGIRGVVATLDGQTLGVRGKDGTVTAVTLAPDWTVRVLVPIGVEAIHPGSFIGTAQMPQADGSGRSLEVHVFPPGVKSGEGERDWDSEPGSRMTNGTVEGEVTSDAKGRELTLAFPSGSRRITIPPDVPIVEFGPGQRAQIKPGVAVFVVAQSAGGGWKASSVSIGQDGAAPPM